MGTELSFADERDWDLEDEELDREHDPVPPSLELRLACEPTEATLLAIAEVVASHGAHPRSRGEAILVSGPFLRLVLPASSSARVVELARGLVPAISQVVDVAEAAMLAPISGPGLAAPGPAWPDRRVRAVDPELPAPRPHPLLDAFFLGDELREALARTGIVSRYGEPRATEGLADVVAAYGHELPDRDGSRDRLLEIARWEEPAAGYLAASIRIVGLLADGRWALAGSSLHKGEPFDPAAAPVSSWILSRKRGDFRKRVSAGLRRYRLAGAFPIETVLRDAFSQFAEGGSVHAQAFAWLTDSPLLDDPIIRGALERRRDEAPHAAAIAALLAPPPTAKERKRGGKKDERKRRS